MRSNRATRIGGAEQRRDLAGGRRAGTRILPQVLGRRSLAASRGRRWRRSPAVGAGQNNRVIQARVASHRGCRHRQDQIEQPLVAAPCQRPLCAQGAREGYRSRAAYKLLEINTRDRLLIPGARVVDLGAAPGGWSQVAAQKVAPGGKVIAVDLLEIAPISGVTVLRGDCREPAIQAQLVEALGGHKADVVLVGPVAQHLRHRVRGPGAGGGTGADGDGFLPGTAAARRACCL